MVKTTKKERIKKGKKAKISKNPPTPNSAQVDLDKTLKTSDLAIIVTATKGNIEVRGIKSINYAYEAKGLLVGALDSYKVIPIAKTLKNVNDINIQLHKRTIEKINEALGIVDKN